MSTLDGGGRISTNDLAIYFNAGNKESYVSGSKICYNLVRNNPLKVGSPATTPVKNVSGSLFNGVEFSASNGGTFVFDGTNDYIDFSTHYFPSSGNNVKTTAIAWFKLTSTATSSNTISIKHPIFGQFEDSAMTGLGVDGGFISMLYFNYPIFTWTKVQTSASVADGNWHQVAFITSTVGYPNNPYWTVYLDGNMVVSQSLLTGFLSSWLDGLGKDRYGAYFSGSIASTQIYNRELTQIEIIRNYNITKGRFSL